MTAQEYFDSISTTDVNQMIIDTTKSKFHQWELIRFAEAYHKAATVKGTPAIDLIRFADEYNSNKQTK